MQLPNRIISLCLVALVAASCTNTSSNSGTDEKSAEQLAEEKIIHDIDKLMKDLPPPSLVPFTLKSIGASFDQGHINSIENFEKYKNDKDKLSLNMGVYASDINYLAAYGKEEACINYLSTSHQIAEILGDTAIYSQADLDAFRGHIASQNEEEIANIISELFVQTSVQMEEDHHLTMAGLALTGSFIEGLYQAALTLETYPNTPENNKLLEPLVKIVLGEEKALLDVLEVLKDLPFDNTTKRMIIELQILDRLYKTDLKEIEAQMKEDPNFVLTKSSMRDITMEIKRIRNEIITP